MAQDRGTGVRMIATPTSQLINCHIRRYPPETHVFLLTKPSLFGYNIWTSTIHNLSPILQMLDGASAVCQDPDTVLTRVENMIERAPLI
ncbi:hypothetical protein TNCV_2616651 [Trichonephila clavipes]|nr:hypothetical protein TNCV_2616651 [Trichonephila clavipes]